jgi:glycosyltransferase involved in cell wall biosynthesis
MPSYNHGGFIKKAIESVLEQENVNLELLITDDGSTDNTVNIINSFSDKRISFLQNKKNFGACRTMNGLIERASGEFIALINSDDSWSSVFKLSQQLAFLQENPNIGACFSFAGFIDHKGIFIDKKTLPFGDAFDKDNRSKAKWLRYFFDHGNCICHPTMLIKKSCYQEIGLYNNALRQLPDFDMWVRLVKKYNIHILKDELINFRVLPSENASSQTPINSIRTINEHLLIAENFFNDIDKDLLIEGFEDVLVNKKITSNIQLDIEKVLLYFQYNQWLGPVYNLIGILNLYKLLNSPDHAKLLHEYYGIDDLWYQKKLGEIDTLRPKMFFYNYPKIYNSILVMRFRSFIKRLFF